MAKVVKLVKYKRLGTVEGIFQKDEILPVTDTMHDELMARGSDFQDLGTATVVDIYTGLNRAPLRAPSEVAASPGVPNNPRDDDDDWVLSDGMWDDTGHWDDAAHWDETT